MGDGGVVASGVVIDVENGRIASLSSGTDRPPRGATELWGLTMPGFANVHSHAFHRALRGRTHGGPVGSFWTWRNQMYSVAGRLDPDSLHAVAAAAFGEMLLAGFTAVGEFHYVHHQPGGVPYAEPNEMGLAIIAAAEDVGIRLTLFDTCYLHGGLGEQGYVEAGLVQRRFSDGKAKAWLERTGGLADGHRLRIGAAIHSLRAVDPEAMRVVAGHAREADRPLHMHVSEQPAENTASMGMFGRSPVGVLVENGVLSERFTAVHGTHLDDEDIAALGASDSGVCLCPTTERELADGIPRSPDLDAAGIVMSLGSDSNAVVDPFEEMRAVELNQRSVLLERGTHSPANLLEMGSRNGYRSLGWPDGGRIAVGQLADLVVLRFDSVRLADSVVGVADAAVVFAAAAADVDTVMVGGDVVVRRGAHRSLNVAAALRSSILEVNP